GAAVFRRYLARASESWTLFLAPTSVRGQWSGATPFEVTTPVEKGALAALTRATVRPRKALQFWRRVPDISTVIGADRNVAFKIGVGEVPLLHQVTFSIWPDSRSMADFARRDGPHARAIAAVRDGDWFREELYARFRVIGEAGTWGGKSPLDHIKEFQ
ncbi:MAG: spheroidene monooxygenase, partial [Roseovarius sp.]